MRVLSVSSSRADAGVLAPVWSALAACRDVDLHVFLTGMHCAGGAPAVEGIPPSVRVHTGGMDLGGTDAGAAAAAMADITRAAGGVYAAEDLDVILIMGDRLDMLPAAVASLPFNIPLVHLHGGEVTEGAIDDRIRHALSKLAHWHCVSCASARQRLLAMGESGDRIVVTGAPGLDTLLSAPVLTKAEFVSRVRLPAESNFRLVTVHPETNAPVPSAPLTAVLEALAARPGSTLFTAPNSDPGGSEMQATIERFVAEYDWAVLVDTLGSLLYPNALRHAAVMIGNSSSGIVEAGVFGLPVINVGDRQKGRERGSNVIDVDNSAAPIVNALDQLGSVPERFPTGSPYGGAGAGRKVAEAVIGLPSRAMLLAKPSPWPRLVEQ